MLQLHPNLPACNLRSPRCRLSTHPRAPLCCAHPPLRCTCYPALSAQRRAAQRRAVPAVPAVLCCAGAQHEYRRVDLHNKAPEFVELYRRLVCDPQANAKASSSLVWFLLDTLGFRRTPAWFVTRRPTPGRAVLLPVLLDTLGFGCAAGRCAARRLNAGLPLPRAGAGAAGRRAADHGEPGGGRVYSEQVRSLLGCVRRCLGVIAAASACVDCRVWMAESPRHPEQVWALLG